MTTWLLLDVNYLAWRAYHSTGKLHHEEIPTGVTFGVISETLRTMERFGTYQCCFCFDYGRPKRLNELPTYKETRKKKRAEASDEEKQEHAVMKTQLEKLRTGALHEMGFRNVFSAKGFEADDVIASLVRTIPRPHKSIIVSSDEDMYQLLGSHSMIWNPNKKQLVTEGVFTEEFGITPAQWIDVKAIAGCKSDDIPGVAGVAEKTAIKYLTGKLKATSAAYQKIILHNRWEANLSLVSLPYARCPKFKRKRDKVTRKKWRSVMDSYGFDSLRANAPV